MTHFSSDELIGMQATQESAMMDECDILRIASGGADSYGKPARVWVMTYASVACGFGYPRAYEGMGLAQQPQVDAVLRLPLDTDITNLDRITVTDRFGVAEADPVTYEISGPVKAGPSGIVLGLKRVTNV